MSWGPPDERFMRMAVEAAAEGIASGQTPFGACLVKEGEVVGLAHNRVWERTDATAHAEIEAIRQACSRLGSIKLTGCEIYSTCEPCPMCIAAIHWAEIGRIIFGARIADAARAGFSEIEIPNREIKRLGGLSVEIVEDFLRGECLALFERWQSGKGKPY